MRTIHLVNKWSLIGNIFLFIIPILGMISMILLGLIQITLAIVIYTLYYESLSKRERLSLHIYWLFVVINLSFMVAIYYSSFTIFNFPGSIPYFVFPGMIAFYFVYLTYGFSKNSIKL